MEYMNYLIELKLNIQKKYLKIDLILISLENIFDDQSSDKDDSDNENADKKGSNYENSDKEDEDLEKKSGDEDLDKKSDDEDLDKKNLQRKL